MDRPASG